MAKKRDFKASNPAEAFITNNPIGETKEAGEAGKEHSEIYIEQQKELERLKALVGDLERNQETRTRRVNLLLKPTDVEKIKTKAKEQKISMNRLIERAIIKYLEEEESK